MTTHQINLLFREEQELIFFSNKTILKHHTDRREDGKILDIIFKRKLVEPNSKRNGNNKKWTMGKYELIKTNRGTAHN